MGCFECRAGEWKVNRRVVVIDWNKTGAMEETFPVGRYRRGSRWPDDPSCEEGPKPCEEVAGGRGRRVGDRGSGARRAFAK